MTEAEKGNSDSRGTEITLKQLIQYIAEALVDFPDKVEVDAIESATSIIIELRVAPDDVGKVIGKGGQTAKAMRKVLSAAATKLRKKSLLQIIEE
ncbi:KH domain-containing protein [Candidatus Sumerlaeota bacterium]|nr:KH domain-containing protein [Candidatus Sumerlaeota bacterium]